MITNVTKVFNALMEKTFPELIAGLKSEFDISCTFSVDQTSSGRVLYYLELEAVVGGVDMSYDFRSESMKVIRARIRYFVMKNFASTRSSDGIQAPTPGGGCSTPSSENIPKARRDFFEPYSKRKPYAYKHDIKPNKS